jgi:hypothetical protein
LFETLAQGQRAGALGRLLRRLAGQLFVDTANELVARQADVERGLTETGAARRAAWAAVLETTSMLASAHELLAQLGSAERRAEELLDEVTLASARLLELARLELPDELLSADLRAQLAEVRAGDADPVRFARSLLGRDLGGAAIVPSMVKLIRSASRLRLLALHATVLGVVADAAPDTGAASEADLASLIDDVAERTRALRDGAREAARQLRGEVASPAWATELWAAVFEFESWVSSEGATRLGAVAAAATARVAGEDADAEHWAREAGQAYDQLRLGLAFDAGIRTVLLAYATHDARALADFAASAGLGLAAATLDLPRSSLAQAANAAEGELVEIDALVSEADFRVGGPSNRSVLTLGTAQAVRVLVPHVAVNSFGIDQGVWLQVRGEAHPDGKDGIEGPVVMASRIRREEAARESFTDALVFAGRALFDLRPGGLDLLAGRVAGSPVTMSEIGRRR